MTEAAAKHFTANPNIGRKTQPKLTPAQREEVRARYQDGETATALAVELGVSAALIRQVAGSRR